MVVDLGFPSEIEADKFWFDLYIPQGFCLVCHCVVGHQRILCLECAKELQNVKNVNVKG